ncbi:TetR/AcrR family transcriptional regulator [Lysobacter sp. CA196]|uniref:TetR/AcrR family transcriptional regulator n=1 Tax=Lysobacter sp. CA196 TaxID=3455606 RepID=UPI003F8D8C4B
MPVPRSQSKPQPEPAPEAGRRERKRNQTLDHLAATAFGLFEARGFEAVTMEQIAEAADVAKGTLYNHFPVKEALLAHQFHGELASAMGVMEGLSDGSDERVGFVSHLSSWLEASAQWYEGRRAYLPHYLRFRFRQVDAAARARDDVGERSGMERLFEAWIEAGQGRGELRDDLSPAHLASLLQHLHLAALMRWLASADGDLENEFAAIVAIFVHGASRPLGVRKPR